MAGNRYADETFADKTGMVIGWGKDGPIGTGTKRLKYTDVPIISNYECSMFWPVTESHVCTSAAYDQDACQVNGNDFLLSFVGKRNCTTLLNVIRATAVVH